VPEDSLGQWQFCKWHGCRDILSDWICIGGLGVKVYGWKKADGRTGIGRFKSTVALISML